jgi:protein-disulfide isomerase
MPDRRFVLTGLVATAGMGLSPLRAAEPEAIRLPVELVSQIETLTAAVPVGPADADVTLVEFFDFNCPYCRTSARELPALLATEPQLRVLLVNYAVLGIESIIAHKVALGVRAVGGDAAFIRLHRALFALSGRIDGERALREAGKLGLSREAVTDAANAPAVTAALANAANLGQNLGLVATPALISGLDAWLGYVSPAMKRRLVQQARR